MHDHIRYQLHHLLDLYYINYSFCMTLHETSLESLLYSNYLLYYSRKFIISSYQRVTLQLHLGCHMLTQDGWKWYKGKCDHVTYGYIWTIIQEEYQCQYLHGTVDKAWFDAMERYPLQSNLLIWVGIGTNILVFCLVCKLSCMIALTLVSFPPVLSRYMTAKIKL